MKKACETSGAKLKYKIGEANNNRTVGELLDSLLNNAKEKQMDTEVIKAIDRLRSAQFFGNVSSHDNTYNENLSDIRSSYEDIKTFENLFFNNHTVKK